MIFVTVGNATQSFLRLLSAVDELAGKGMLGEGPVVIQSGHSDGFLARNCEQVDFLKPEAFAGLISRAQVVICHGGAGTLHHVFHEGKVPVVMPRRRIYGEHVDDQLSLVQALESQGRVIAAYEPVDLSAAVDRCITRSREPIPSPPSRMIQLVSTALDEIIAKKQAHRWAPRHQAPDRGSE